MYRILLFMISSLFFSAFSAQAETESSAMELQSCASIFMLRDLIDANDTPEKLYQSCNNKQARDDIAKQEEIISTADVENARNYCVSFRKVVPEQDKLEFAEKCDSMLEGNDSDMVFIYDYIINNIDNADTKQQLIELLIKLSKVRVKAKYLLGIGYYYGVFGDSSNIYALFWLTDAAKFGDPYAMFLLGQIYRNSDFLSREHNATKWFSNAHDILLQRPSFDEGTYPEFYLGEIYLNGLGVNFDSKKGIEYLKSAANIGSRNTLFYLGQIYSSGLFGITPNFSLSIQYYKEAAKLGHVQAILITEELE